MEAAYFYGGDQVERRAISVVAAGEHHGARAGRHGKPVEVGAHGTGQHHTRPVVAREHNRSLEGSRGEDDAAGSDVPQTALGPVARASFGNGHEAVVVGAEGCRAGHDAQRGSAGMRGIPDRSCESSEHPATR